MKHLKWCCSAVRSGAWSDSAVKPYEPENEEKRMKYVLSIDQSTQGTKALIFDETGSLLARADKSHQQIINDRGWVEHNPEKIWQNTLQAAREATVKAGIPKEEIAYMEANQSVPKPLASAPHDPFYPDEIRIHLRRTCGNA